MLYLILHLLFDINKWSGCYMLYPFFHLLLYAIWIKWPLLYAIWNPIGGPAKSLRLLTWFGTSKGTKNTTDGSVCIAVNHKVLLVYPNVIG